MGRKCSVPHCYTGYRQCKEKAALYKVPDDDFFLSKWQDAIAREDRPITPKDYVCEKHFKEEDILRKRIIKDVVEEYQRPKLKPDAIPSIFPEWPEFISKMTKKRRKMPTETKDIVDTNKINYYEQAYVEPIKDTEQVDIALNNEEIEIKMENEEPMNAQNQNDSQEKEEEDPLGVKMYRCGADDCKYKTPYIHNLRTHKTKHLSGINAYIHCNFCDGYKTKWDQVFNNHMKTKHEIVLTEVIKCSFCNFRTKVEQCLNRHCVIEHPGQVTPEKAKQFTRLDLGYAVASKNMLNSQLVQEHRESDLLHTDMDIDAAGTTIMKFKQWKKDSHNKKAKKISCSRCLYKTTSHTLLEKHLLKHQITQLNNSNSSNHHLGNVDIDYINNNNDNKDDTMRMSTFDVVTIKEDRSSDDVFSE